MGTRRGARLIPLVVSPSNHATPRERSNAADGPFSQPASPSEQAGPPSTPAGAELAATPGFAARYGLRGCARPFQRTRQGTWRFELLGVPTQWAPSLNLPGRAAVQPRLTTKPAPGTGLPPASSTVPTACYQVLILRHHGTHTSCIDHQESKFPIIAFRHLAPKWSPVPFIHPPRSTPRTLGTAWRSPRRY